jgi:hypothetical protein
MHDLLNNVLSAVGGAYLAIHMGRVLSSIYKGVFHRS